MDYRLYHSVNLFAAHHPWLAHAAAGLETWGVIGIAVATFALWLAARPGGSPKWKLASASSLASAALALLVNQLLGKAWHRARPYQAHRGAHVWVARSHDPSFPSDHASAAFGIAVSVFLFDRLVGALFLAAATAIAVGRVVVGAHYPGDVVAGALVGAAGAVVVVRLARPVVAFLAHLVERVTDPLLRPLWRTRRTAS